MNTITKEIAHKLIKEIDPDEDLLSVRYCTLALIILGFTQEEAFEKAIEHVGVGA